ncbi:hypothetical protein L1987_66883 [Smallanthus sonchifolius]|uniref:Uncharacterized protein n=1 Tax=Smallanthus sonchifolius TaxID=185202 RepID=A0ACB9BYP5_9ASTR|nr:hypothetical protein L1987_66883 [Smallanthus sonchifolius]
MLMAPIAKSTANMQQLICSSTGKKETKKETETKYQKKLGWGVSGSRTQIAQQSGLVTHRQTPVRHHASPAASQFGSGSPLQHPAGQTVEIFEESDRVENRCKFTRKRRFGKKPTANRSQTRRTQHSAASSNSATAAPLLPPSTGPLTAAASFSTTGD